MIGFIKRLFGMENNNYAELFNKGAQIIDVRTVGEYAVGHINGSINIPLQSLKDNLHKINKEHPVITCCASGMRSASAKGLLKSNGFTEVYNGGGWINLNSKLSH